MSDFLVPGVKPQQVKNNKTSTPWHSFIIHFLCILPSIFIFFRVTGYDFILVDDGVNIYENPFLGPPFIENTLSFWKAAYEHLYIPVTYTAWQSISALSQGIKPGFFHVANLTIHLLNTLTLLALLYRIERNFLVRRKEGGQTDFSNAKKGALVGALIFSIHPLQVESVCWITELKGLLAAFFSFLSIHLYLSFFSTQKKTEKSLFYLASTITFILALLSKPSAIMLPFIVFIFTSFVSGARTSRFVPLVLWMSLIVPIVVITKMAQPDTELEFLTPWYFRPLIAIDAASFYIHKFFFPINLSIDYGRSPEHILQTSQTWAYNILAVATLLLLVAYRNKAPFFKYLLITLLALFPVLGLVPFLFQKISTVSDHYFYMSMLGPALIFSRLTTLKWGRPALRSIIFLIIAIMACQSFYQVHHWKDSLSVFKHTVKVTPSSTLGHTNLGKYYFLNGNLSKARYHYQKMVSYHPESPLHLINLASSYFALGRNFESIKTFEKALNYAPDFVVAHQNLAKIFKKMGKYEKALFHAKESFRIKPDELETKKLIAQLILLNKPSR